MEILLISVIAALLITSIVAVTVSIRRDGRGLHPPVHAGRPWHGHELWDTQDPADRYFQGPYTPPLR